ncbi:hypothetical protein [Allorhodopirellula heiligendammensis]|uniref:Tetratricopeptide repeat protein n=1 Tax=Allorhodopirellula heiligendammensis TaxID=2714739 RepID=A0A5C6C5M8_9BACT|nr:hypothetical protein [Allorhodopirellula heiligendammensis]TWU18644.1 hypothetical protein Poly21_08080 [Allorhodopirellula heiligendammensis]
MTEMESQLDQLSTDEGLRVARARYQAGRLAEVIAMASKVVERPAADGLPENHQGPWWELLGLALHDFGQPLDAADAIEKASLVSPISDETRIVLASCYAELMRIDLARDLYLQLAIRRALPAELMLQIAAGLEAIDSPQLAMQVCEWVTEKDDSHAQAFYDMGFYSARAGQPLYLTEALTQRAVQLDPGNLHYRIGLVSLLIQLNRDDEAIFALGTFTEDDVERVTCASCLSRISALLERRGFFGLADECDDKATRIREEQSPAPAIPARGDLR